MLCRAHSSSSFMPEAMRGLSRAIQAGILDEPRDGEETC
jgi:hypothetical protein